ncbi:MAG: BBP7 family outer membrane beta-barrel protein [Gemmataceae bacterium]
MTTAWALLACLSITSSLVAQAPEGLGPGFQPPPGGPIPAVPGYIPPTSILNPSPQTIDNPAMANAFDERERLPNPTSVNLGFEYMLLWIRRPSFPPLVTTGNVADTPPGALGQPGTRILSDGGDLAAVNGASAGRFTFSWVPAGYDWFGIDANYMIMEQRSQFSNINSNATGNPVLARPYFNTATGTEAVDPRAFPGSARLA